MYKLHFAFVQIQSFHCPVSFITISLSIPAGIFISISSFSVILFSQLHLSQILSKISQVPEHSGHTTACCIIQKMLWLACITCHFQLHFGQVLLPIQPSQLHFGHSTFLLKAIFCFHQKILVFKSIFKMYSKSSQGTSLGFLVLLENPPPKNESVKESNKSHKSTSTQEKPELENGLELKLVLQNISY
jgi:hypothetical protein